MCSGRKPARNVASTCAIEPPPPVIRTRRPPKLSCSSSTDGTGSRRSMTACQSKSSAGRRRAARCDGRRGQRQRALDRAIPALHVYRARGVGLVDLRDDEGDELAEPAHDGVEFELARAVRQPLAEQAVRVGHVGDLGGRAELFDIALERELLVRGAARRASRIRGREGAKQGGMRGVESEAELGHALAPFEEVTPMAADLREEDAARPHAQDRRDVLDQTA